MLKEKKIKYQNKFKIDINKYAKGRLIKKGGFGIVYLVTEKETSKEYAAKVLLNEDDTPIDHQMANREIGIMIRVQHPTIIQFRGYSLEDLDHNKNIVILMDFAKKGSLSKLLQNARNSMADPDYTNTARQIILIGIARGMMYLHQQHIIHRDLKPENVLIDENLHPLITDFGLSKIYEVGHSMTQSKACGTTIYMAPEVISEDRYNGKADVYSFGILMYEVLTEEIPYPSFQRKKLSDFNLKAKIVNEDLRPDFTVPVKPALKKLITQCWARDPHSRPTFEEIYNKLAFNIESSAFDIYDEQAEDDTEEDMNKYYLDDVDVDEILCYTDDISENLAFSEALSKSGDDELTKIWDQVQRKEKIFQQKMTYFKTQNQLLKDEMKKQQDKLDKKLEDEIAKKNEEISSLQEKVAHLEEVLSDYDKIPKIVDPKSGKMKRINVKADANMTIQKFNDLSLQMQKMIIANLISESPDKDKADKKKADKSFTKLNQLFVYFSELDFDDESKYYVEIPCKNSKEKLCNLKGIHILSNAVEALYKCRSLDSSDLLNILDQFDEVLIQIKYPIKSFQAIYNIISSTQRSKLKKIQLSVFVAKISEKGETFEKYPNINLVEFDDSFTSVNDFVFKNCVELKKIIIPISVVSIGNGSFSGCSTIKEISIPPSISTIGDRVFAGCSSLVNIEIPSVMSSIGRYCFYDCASLETIVIPTSMAKIEKGMFEGCRSLKEIEFPLSVKIIDDRAFAGCLSLDKIEIPSTVTNIGHEVFKECTSLKEIIIDPYSTKTETDSFKDCHSLKHMIINQKVKKISQIKMSESSLIAFNKAKDKLMSEEEDESSGRNYAKSKSKKENSCSYRAKKRALMKNMNRKQNEDEYEENDDEIDEKRSIKSDEPIRSSEFYLPASIEEVTLPKSATKIESKAFFNCQIIKKINIPSSITLIESEAFNMCKSLCQITIPTSVKSMNTNCFGGCSSLKQITIPSSIEVIEERTFENCTSLEEISFPASVKTIKSNAFAKCKSLTKVVFPNTVKKIDHKSFACCTSLNEITIDPSSTEMESDSFIGCTSLTRLVINSKIKSIKKYFIHDLFKSIDKMKSEDDEEEARKPKYNKSYKKKNKKYKKYNDDSDDNCENEESPKYKYAKKSMKSDDSEYTGCNSMPSINEITIPDSVTLIENNAFYRSDLVKIAIPSSVTKIEDEAFKKCLSLEQIVIPSSVRTIGKECFARCSNLEEITIDLSRTKVEENAFLNCSSLDHLIIYPTVKIIDQSYFKNIITPINIDTDGKSKKKISYGEEYPEEDYDSCKCEYEDSDDSLFSITQITIPDSVTKINERSFAGFTSLVKINIPSSVTTIEERTLEKCQSLKKITISMSVTSIKDRAFCDCSSLSTIDIPPTVKSIGRESFKGCKSLKEITIDPYSTNIETDTFKECQIFTVNIQNGVKTINQFNYNQFFNREEPKPVMKKDESDRYPQSKMKACNKQKAKNSESPMKRNTEYIQICIPSTVTSIEDNAFEGCVSVEKVEIPSSVISIGASSFKGCSQLKEIEIPTSVTKIGESAFEGCISLDTMKIPSSVTSICASTFKGCISLHHVELPAVKSLGKHCFCECSSLEEFCIMMPHSPLDSKKKSKSSYDVMLAIPSSVTSIEEGSFEKCALIKHITIPESVASIKDRAFCDCSSLIAIDIPPTVKSVGCESFKGCKSLREITIDPYSTNIETDAFKECEIYTVNIQNGVKTIKPYNYNQLLGENKVQLPIKKEKKAKKYESNCSYSEDDYDESSYNKKVTMPAPEFNICIPSTVTSIEDNAFEGCVSVEKVEIPSSVISIGASSFKGCSQLKEIEIPTSVTKIGESAFEGCISLDTMKIPSSVTSICASTFKGCISLHHVELPAVKSLGKHCFYECTSLVGFALPSSVTSIEERTFEKCQSLKQMTISRSITSIKGRAFCDCSSLSTINIPPTVKSVGCESFKGCKSLREITIDPYSTNIEADAFKECQILTVNIQNGVKTIKPYNYNLFFTREEPKQDASDKSDADRKPQSKLKSSTRTRPCIRICIPPTATSIENNAFEGCTLVEEVSIPSSVTAIGACSFKGCSQLKVVDIPLSVASIGENAFKGCNLLSAIDLPSATKSSKLGVKVEKQKKRKK